MKYGTVRTITTGKFQMARISTKSSWVLSNQSGEKSLSYNNTMNVRFLFSILLFASIVATPVNAQLAGTPGAFTRLGFGARGMGMGNALTAVVDGEITSFYNPAVTPFLTDRVAAVSVRLAFT